MGPIIIPISPRPNGPISPIPRLSLTCRRLARNSVTSKPMAPTRVLAKIVPLINQHKINLKVAVGIYEAEANRSEAG